MRKGFIQVYTGDGKGKTTAAVGLTIRAIGNGLKVFFVQFIKSTHSGEIEILNKFSDYVDIYRCPTGFIYEIPDEKQIEKVKECLKEIKNKITTKKYDLIVLDEMTVAINTCLISRMDAETIINMKPPQTELVITGRDAPEWICEKADLVTEMKKIKHYFDKGVKARKGIEY